MRITVLIVFSAILLAPAALRGEDSWLIADNHALNNGEPLWLSFVTGQVFPFGDAPSRPADVDNFVDWCGDEIRQVIGYARQDRGLSIRQPITGTGIHVIGCTLKRQIVQIPAEEFVDYLRREHADKALAVLEQRPDSDAAVCEAYTKFAKTIVEVDPARPGDGGYRIPLGHRLEIIPLSNPCHWRDGSTVEVQVRLDGYCWPDVAVSAGHEVADDEVYAVQTMTDAKGVATIPLSRPGHWFIRAHVIRPTDGIGRAQWESFWASLTFQVAGPTDMSEILRTARAIDHVVGPWLVAGYKVAHRALDEVARDVLAMTRPASGRRSPVAALSPASGLNSRTAGHPQPLSSPRLTVPPAPPPPLASR